MIYIPYKFFKWVFKSSKPNELIQSSGPKKQLVVKHDKKYIDNNKDVDLLELQLKTYKLIDEIRKKERETGYFNLDEYRRLKSIVKNEISPENTISTLKKKNINEAILWYSELKSRQMFFSEKSYNYLNDRVNKELDASDYKLKDLDNLIYNLKEICKFRISSELYDSMFKNLYKQQESEYLDQVLNKTVLKAKKFLTGRYKEYYYFSNKLLELRDNLVEDEEVISIKKRIGSLQSRISRKSKPETQLKNEKLLLEERKKMKNYIQNIINKIF